MIAPRPISHVTMDTRVPAAAPARASPSSTLATMRAQLLPALFMKAIQTHSPMLIRPMATEPTMTTDCRLWSCVAVSDGSDFFRLFFRLPTVARPTIRLSALTTAPAYMSLTAITTDCGGGAGTPAGSGILPPDEGYGWYDIAAPQADPMSARSGRNAADTDDGAPSLAVPPASC